MDILIYEHILGEELSNDSSQLIINEAKLIIKALVEDFSELYPQSKISLLVNKNNKKILGNINLVYMDYSKDLVKNILLNHKKNRRILILAPEEKDLLYRIVKSLEKKDLILLNCNSKFLKTTSCKILTHKKFSISNKYVNPVYANYKEIPPEQSIVAKIKDGIGAEKLYIFKNQVDLKNNECKLSDNHVFQKYISGDVIGINIFSDSNSLKILSINKQIYKFSSKHEIFLDKIIMGQFNNLIKDLKIFVNNIIEHFDGHYGFFGIDAILENNGNIVFLEINPRLTTSYAGLKKTLGFNPAIFFSNPNYKHNINNNKVFSIEHINE